MEDLIDFGDPKPVNPQKQDMFMFEEEKLPVYRNP